MSDSDIDNLEDNTSEIDFIPCLAWVRRGVAKPEPEKVKLSKEELMEIINQTKVCRLYTKLIIYL